MEAYFLSLLILVTIYWIFSLSLQVSLGFAGFLNFGHIAFIAIGAYASSLLSKVGVPFGLSILLGATISMMFGYLVALPCRRLKGDYLALITLGFSLIVFVVALNWAGLTGGPAGLADIPSPQLFGISLASNSHFLVFSFFVSLCTYLIIKRLSATPFGTALQAARDDELGTQVLGISTFKLITVSFALSAFFAGLGGGLFAHYITFIDPSLFTLSQFIPILAIVILGGLTSLEGTLLATVVVVLLPEPLRFLSLSSSVIGPARELSYSLLLLILLVLQPRGFYGKIRLK